MAHQASYRALTFIARQISPNDFARLLEDSKAGLLCATMMNENQSSTADNYDAVYKRKP